MPAGNDVGPEPISIDPYDPEWPRRFEAERARLACVLPPSAVIAHTGSTAVPGLAAKPVIDILVGLDSLALATACIRPLANLGYRYLPEAEAYIPHRRYFEKLEGTTHTHHLHMVERTSSFFRDQGAFRDALRRNTQLAAEYAELKRRLAAEYGTDRVGYALAKDSFVARVLRWAGANPPGS